MSLKSTSEVAHESEELARRGAGPRCPGCRQVPTREELSDPSVWGRAWWTSMLATAYAYPDEPSAQERECYANYFNTVAKVLPCPKCRGHFAELLKEHPVEPHLASGAQLREWLISRKNDVNLRLGKECPTTQHVCKTWKQKLYRHRVKTWATAGIVLGLVGFAVLLAILFYYLGKRQAKKTSSRPVSERELPAETPTVFESPEVVVPRRPVPSRKLVRSGNRPSTDRGALVESYLPTSP